MNLPDLGKLSEPRQEVELMDDEAAILLSSSRCQKCRHLSCFHAFGFVSDPNSPKEMTSALGCRICNEVCSYVD